MNDRNRTRLSKKLSWLLRHGAPSVGLRMDAAGWVAVGDVIANLRISRATLEEMVATNTKRRLQLEGERVRCCQGHSTEGMPVTAEALEATWTRWAEAERIWHGTSLNALDAIAAEGIRPQRRTHVHLAAELDSRVGKRAQVDVMLAVSVPALEATGFPVYAAPNGVLLCREVPAHCVTALEPRTRKARAAMPDAWQRFRAKCQPA